MLVALTVVAYLPVLDAGFIWDDDDYVTANATLRTLDGLRRIWLEPGAVPQYYPLTFTSFWLEYRLWGVQPFGYHLVNVLLHALSAVLLWRLLDRLRVPAAWVAAAVFAVHPIQVESVAWITERKNVLSGLLALAALLVAVGGGVPMNGEPMRWRRYVAAGGLFVAALLSKTVTCTLPAIVLLLAWWRRGSLARRTVVMVAPLFLLGLVMAGVTVWMERHHVGAAGADWTLSPIGRVLVAGRALWFYPRTLVWPRALTFIYPRWTIDVDAWWQYLFPAAAAAVVAALWLARARIGRGALVATLCYGAALAPALGFFDVYPMRYSFVADHFAYLAMIGLVVLVTAGGAELARGARTAGYVASAAVLVVLAALTARQCRIYRDLRTLWSDTLAKNPGCWMAHNNLGALLVKQGAIDDGITHLVQALRLKPDNPQAENDLGVALDMQGKTPEAISHYLAALRLDPDYANAHYNLADALRTHGRLADAIAHYREVLRLKPDHPEAHNNLGATLAARGETAEGVAHLEEALRLKPGYAEAHFNLGTALLAAGRRDEGVAHLAAGLRIDPRSAAAHDALGVALAAEGKVAESILHFEAALRLKPDDAKARAELERLRGSVPR